MDDSSLFMQWAMDTLHQQHPSAAAPAYTDGGGGEGASSPSLQALRSASQTTAAAGVRDLTVQVDHRASSWSSGDSPGVAMDHDAAAGWSPHTARARTGGGGFNRPMRWNFSAASAQPTDESGGGVALPDAAGAPRAHTPVGKRGGSVAPAAAGGSAATAAPSGYVQDHVIAERRRREKINRSFIELSTVIPGLKKTDKATILGDAVNYVRELQEKVKSLEDDRDTRSHTSSIQSVVLVKKPSLTSDADDGSPSSSSAAHGGDSGLPEIEARLSEKSVLLRIHCENARGLLVRVLSEVEELRLAITHTSVMPFPACTVIITITAKVEKGFKATGEEIVRRLNSALHQYYSGNTEETRRK